MTSFVENHLKKYLKDVFIAVHKSKELNQELGTWERNILRINEDKIEEACDKIARNVTVFIDDEKSRGRNPTNPQIMKKIKEELNSL